MGIEEKRIPCWLISGMCISLTRINEMRRHQLRMVIKAVDSMALTLDIVDIEQQINSQPFGQCGENCPFAEVVAQAKLQIGRRFSDPTEAPAQKSCTSWNSIGKP